MKQYAALYTQTNKKYTHKHIYKEINVNSVRNGKITETRKERKQKQHNVTKRISGTATIAEKQTNRKKKQEGKEV